MTGPSWWDISHPTLRIATTLTPSTADLLRQTLRKHANHPFSGMCPWCGVPRCPTFVDAYDRLAAAGAAMSDDKFWEQPYFQSSIDIPLPDHHPRRT